MTIWQTEDLEEIACDLCRNGASKDVILRPDGLKVVECLRCGLAYVSPRPKGPMINRLYEGDYFTKPDRSARSSCIGYANYFSEKNRAMLGRIAIEKHAVAARYVTTRSARCLEIGCAAGEFSALLAKKGAHVLGIDLSARAIEEAKSRYPAVEFRQADLTEVEEGPFDAIFGFEVVEHVTSPSAFLDAAAKRLRAHGTLILTTPNYACGKAVGVERWYGFSTSFEHLYFFSPEALSACASAAGLELVDWLTDLDKGTSGPEGAATRSRSALASVRCLLETLHLLSTAKKVKRALLPPSPTYQSRGQGHNLFMVFRKAQG